MECPLLVPFDSQSLLEASKDNTFKIISWKRYLFQSKMFSDNPSITSLTVVPDDDDCSHNHRPNKVYLQGGSGGKHVESNNLALLRQRQAHPTNETQTISDAVSCDYQLLTQQSCIAQP